MRTPKITRSGATLPGSRFSIDTDNVRYPYMTADPFIFCGAWTGQSLPVLLRDEILKRGF